MDNNLTICVITYNSANYLPDLIESLGNATFKDYNTLFIDNASTDGTVEFIKKSGFEGSLIELEENKGHSYAANLALDKCNTRFLILLDHDTVVDKELFERLYNKAEEETDSAFAVFAPKIIDKSRNETHYGGEFHFIGKTYTNRKMPGAEEVGMISSTAPLIDRNKIPEDLRFDDDFFIYWNDADFFYRLRAIGLKIKLVSDAVVYHLAGTQGYSHRQGTKYSSNRAFFVIRNHRLLVLKDYSLKSILLFLPCFLLYELYNMVFCIKRGIFIKGYLRSMTSTAALLPSILKKRSNFQKNRKLTEKNLISWQELDYNPGVVNSSIEKTCVLFLDKVFKIWYKTIKYAL